MGVWGGPVLRPALTRGSVTTCCSSSIVLSCSALQKLTPRIWFSFPIFPASALSRRGLLSPRAWGEKLTFLIRVCVPLVFLH